MEETTQTQKPEGKGMAVAGFVISLVGLVFYFIIAGIVAVSALAGGGYGLGIFWLILCLAGTGFGSLVFGLICQAIVNPNNQKANIVAYINGVKNTYLEECVANQVPKMFRVLAGIYLLLGTVAWQCKAKHRKRCKAMRSTAKQGKQSNAKQRAKQSKGMQTLT